MTKNKNIKIGAYSAVLLENTNTAKIIPVGFLKQGEKTKDRIIKDDCFNYDDIQIKVMYCESIMTNFFLESSKKIPISYYSVHFGFEGYDRTLFDIFIYFEITEEITNKRQLINKPIEGKVTIEFLETDKLVKIKDIEEFTTMTNLKDFIKNKLDSEKMQEFMQKKINKVKDEITEKVGDLFTPRFI